MLLPSTPSGAMSGELCAALCWLLPLRKLSGSADTAGPASVVALPADAEGCFLCGNSSSPRASSKPLGDPTSLSAEVPLRGFPASELSFCTSSRDIASAKASPESFVAILGALTSATGGEATTLIPSAASPAEMQPCVSSWHTPVFLARYHSGGQAQQRALMCAIVLSSRSSEQEHSHPALRTMHGCHHDSHGPSRHSFSSG